MTSLQCKIINGIREGSHLVHVPSENMLYVFKAERNGGREYICYQSILASPKKRITNNNHISCTARIRLLTNNTCERMTVQHTSHNDHLALISDIRKRNNMKNTCNMVRDRLAEDSHKISARHIFQREISK